MHQQKIYGHPAATTKKHSASGMDVKIQRAVHKAARIIKAIFKDEKPDGDLTDDEKECLEEYFIANKSTEKHHRNVNQFLTQIVSPQMKTHQTKIIKLLGDKLFSAVMAVEFKPKPPAQTLELLDEEIDKLDSKIFDGNLSEVINKMFRIKNQLFKNAYTVETLTKTDNYCLKKYFSQPVSDVKRFLPDVYYLIKWIGEYNDKDTDIKKTSEYSKIKKHFGEDIVDLIGKFGILCEFYKPKPIQFHSRVDHIVTTMNRRIEHWASHSQHVEPLKPEEKADLKEYFIKDIYMVKKRSSVIREFIARISDLKDSDTFAERETINTIGEEIFNLILNFAADKTDQADEKCSESQTSAASSAKPVKLSVHARPFVSRHSSLSSDPSPQKSATAPVFSHR